MKPVRPSLILILGTVLSGFACIIFVNLPYGFPDSVSDILLEFLAGMGIGLVVFGTIEAVVLIRARLSPEFKRKVRLILLMGVLAMVLCRLLIPCPVRGNWNGDDLTHHLCDDHAFVRFADGKTTFYHDNTPPTDFGTFTKVGWNTYRWSGSDINDGKPVIIHCGWLFLRCEGFVFKPVVWVSRDFSFSDCGRIIRVTDALPRKSPKLKTKHE